MEILLTIPKLCVYAYTHILLIESFVCRSYEYMLAQQLLCISSSKHTILIDTNEYFKKPQ